MRKSLNGRWSLYFSGGVNLIHMPRNIPIPYYALSSLLTLFSHDMPTLALIQHTFDYLLVRTPVASVYIAAAVGPFYPTCLASHSHTQMVLSRKEEVTWFEAMGEEGMLHSILSGLPILYEEGEEGDPQIPLPEAEVTQEAKAEDVVGVVEEINNVDVHPNSHHAPESTAESELPSVTKPIVDASFLTPTPSHDREGVVTQLLLAKPSSTSSGDLDSPSDLSTPLPDLSTTDADRAVLDGEPHGDKSPTFTDKETTLLNGLPMEGESEETKPAPTPTSTPPSEPEPEASVPWPDTPSQPAKARMSLSALLRQADDLLARFPPSHPKLDLDKIMGPRSTVFTWTESFSSLPPDDELEQYVKTPNLVVLPYVDPVEEAMTKEKEEMRKVGRRKKLLRKGLFARSNVHKKAVFAGAVLALGIAVAVYGIRSPGDAGRGHHRGDLKKLLRYVGGLLLAGGDKLIGRFLGF